MMNSIYLSGALASDPESKKGKKSTYTKFVVNHNGSTEKRNATVEFIAFGEVAEVVTGLRSGQDVVVPGRFQTGTYTGQRGTFTKTSNIADSISLA